MILLPAHPASFAHKFLFQRVPGCNSIADLSLKIVFWTHNRVFSQHFGNMTRPLELGIFASFYTKLGKNTPYNKNKNIKYFVYSTSYSSLTHKQTLKSDLQSDLPFVVGAQKNPLIKMVLLSTHNICFA